MVDIDTLLLGAHETLYRDLEEYGADAVGEFARRWRELVAHIEGLHGHDVLHQFLSTFALAAGARVLESALEEKASGNEAAFGVCSEIWVVFPPS